MFSNGFILLHKKKQPTNQPHPPKQNKPSQPNKQNLDIFKEISKELHW